MVKQVIVLLTGGLAALLAATTPAGAAGPTTSRVSVSSAEVQGNDSSEFPSVSADGRYVLFASDADNLVPHDTNGGRDVFIRDRQTGTTWRGNVSSGGVQADDVSFDPAMSRDGRYVVYGSNATNLVPGDTNATCDVFRRDRRTGVTIRVSLRNDGAQADGCSFGPVVSDSGRYVAFVSSGNLAGGVDNHKDDIFVRDIAAATTRQLSRNSSGQQGNANSAAPAISADGHFVAFVSRATNLVSGTRSGGYLANLRTGSLVRMNDVGRSVLSATGRFVAFETATPLVTGDDNNSNDAYVRDLTTGTNELVNRSTGGVVGDAESSADSISPDGRYVSFTSNARNLVPGTGGVGTANVFLRDRVAGTTTRISSTPAGGPTVRDSFSSSVSADGRLVAFESDSGKLVTGDSNGVLDVFVRDLG